MAGPLFQYLCNKGLLMYKSSLITIIWLCILSFIPDQASAQTHQAANSTNKGFNVPEELLTTWELDEAASMEYAKSLRTGMNISLI